MTSTHTPPGMRSARRRGSVAAATAPAAAIGTDASAFAAGGPLAGGAALRTRIAGLALAGLTASLALPLVLAAPAQAEPTRSFIVRADAGALPALVQHLDRVGDVTREIPLISGAVVTLSPRAAAALAGRPGVLSVSPDMAVQTATYDAAADGYSAFSQQKSAAVRQAWAGANGVTGAGVDVAVLDTGVSAVPGLTGRNADGRDKLIHGADLSFDSQVASRTNKDLFGHGTAMAGIIAGRDAGANPKGAPNDAAPYLGVAPDARIVSVKVGDSRGAVDVSQVIAGIDWVVAHAKDPGMNIRVLNLSLGYPTTQDYRLDPLSFAAEQAWKRGIVVVASAGNDGTGTGRLMMPAANPTLLAVGALDTGGTERSTDDSIPAFSTRGDTTRNPDLVAPGRSVQTIVPADSAAALGNPSRLFGTGNRFLNGSGTSEAAAQVSGAVALLLEKDPSLTPNQVKRLLRSSAQLLENADRTSQGRGRLNVARALASEAPPRGVTQDNAAATGTGSLDASRGGLRLKDDTSGKVLDGERDIMGRTFDSAAQAKASAAGASWSGGTWNGASWSGASWSGASWSGASWSGASWSGASWSGASWSGASWSGASWSGASWSGASWSGASWSSAGWQGTFWI